MTIDPAVARCANHPDVAAVEVCSRCGSYLCEACAVARDPTLCRACGGRALLQAPPFSFNASFRLGGKLFQRIWNRVVVIAALVTAAETAISMLWPHLNVPALGAHAVWYLFSIILWMTLGVFGAGAVIATLVAAAEHRRCDLREAFRESARRWKRLAGANLLATALTVLYALMLIVPGIIKLLDYALVPLAAWDGEAEPLERSTALVRGHRPAMLGFLAVSLGLGLLVAVVQLVLLAVAGEDLGELGRGVQLICGWASLLCTYYMLAVYFAAYRSLRRMAELRQALQGPP